MSIRSWGWFLAWTVVGAGYALVLVGILSIGIFVLPFPIVGTILLSRWVPAGRTTSATGLLSGLSLPFLYVAFLNRTGPTTCPTSATVTPGGHPFQCTQESSPWPWLVVGIILLLAGPMLFGAFARRAARHAGRPDPERPGTT